MSDKANPDNGEKKHMGGELVIPVAALIFTLYYFSTIIDVPWTAQVSALFVGSILIVLIGVFVVRTLRQVRAGEADLGMNSLIRPVGYIPKRLALLAVTLGFILLVEHLGFTITVFLFLSSAMLLLGNGRRKGLAVAIAAIVSLAGWALFIWAFETRFPAGPFEKLMSGLL
jgi:hypothetical protein